MTKDQATKRRSYHLSLYQMQGIVKITERPDYKEVLKINIGEAIYRLMCHDELVEALKDITGWCQGYENLINNPMALKVIDKANQALNHAKGDS